VGMTGSVVEVTRGQAVESRHVVHVAVARAAGTLEAGSGDVVIPTFARSAIKAMQALPLVEDGVLAQVGWGDDELALACASHSGEPVHVEIVRRMVAGLGLREETLACGPQTPMNRSAAAALREGGELPGRLHNNCSGKHAGMLALAAHHGWALDGYHRAGHPVQERMLGELIRWCTLPAADVMQGVDGCGVVTFALPLASLAMGFARFAGAASTGEPGPARVAAAMAARPHLVAGTDRLCTVLMSVTGGRILAKVGAEGVYGVMVPSAELGIALKVEDGGRRAAEPAVLAVLRELALLDAGEWEALAEMAEPAVENTRREKVGMLRARVRLEAAGVARGAQ
jgi:L-asparaginase II